MRNTPSAGHLWRGQGVETVVHAARDNLGMDVGFVSEFVGDRRVVRHVDAKSRKNPIRRGSSVPLDEGYCKKIVDGLLPELIPDTAQVPAALEIPATRDVPIGAHISVPLRLSDGRVYGTFCCFSFDADASLNERDLRTMRTFAGLISSQIDTNVEHDRNRTEKMQRITAALEAGEPAIVYQPVFRLSDGSAQGAEALARFAQKPARTPDKWFAEAGEAGLKTQLELQAIANALAGFRAVWDKAPLSLKLNVSPQTIVAGDLAKTLEGYPARHLVLEITEHDHVENYGELVRALAPLRAQGVRVAIDDAGSGYASMRHVLNLKPDVIKLDISLTRDIDSDPMKRALASALISFGNQIECYIVAEGIETSDELDTLRKIGVHAGQGYHLSRPAGVDALIALIDQRSSSVTAT